LQDVRPFDADLDVCAVNLALERAEVIPESNIVERSAA
jgi:hypothetical protein